MEILKWKFDDWKNLEFDGRNWRNWKNLEKLEKFGEIGKIWRNWKNLDLDVLRLNKKIEGENLPLY
jgi:hypothetical protein